MTDYSKLSDFEINKIVCDVFWPYFEKSSECKNKTFPQSSSVVYMENGYGGFSRDYCNNPADAWPIVVENDIALLPSCGFDWVAISPLTLNGFSSYIDQSLHGCLQHNDMNPLRAAMIVFLMMQEKKE